MNDVDALLNEWLRKVKDPITRIELEKLKTIGDEDAVRDAFYQDLQFGTAGLRGIIGAGTNRMNIYTVGRASQGFADYLNANFENPSVAIARDSRHRGEEFVQHAACVFAANGIKTYVYPHLAPTPALSFAVRDLGCSGGVNITASHNSSSYNGYKAYGPDGCQITKQVADDISEAIAAVDLFEGVVLGNFKAALHQGQIEWIGEETNKRFLEAVAAQSVALSEDISVPLKVVYTPLNGAGLECVMRILKRMEITDVTVVPEQKMPDGDFPTCPYPNPETREALQKGLDLCEKTQADLLLATDPDADRVGVAVKNGEEYVLLSGNEIGVLLLDYIARMLTARAISLHDKVAITTIVSSMMVDAVAASYGFSVKRVLTGFKYIGEEIGKLEKRGQVDRFMFGFEESYGYLSGAHVRDKDAVNASMLICQMAQHYKRCGLTLVQARDELFKTYGFYENRTLAFSYPGASGAKRMSALMTELRRTPPTKIVDLKVEKTLDYKTGINNLPAADVIEFQMGQGNKVIIRPSGTEPKIKAYLFAKGADLASTMQLLTSLEKAVTQLLS